MFVLDIGLNIGLNLVLEVFQQVVLHVALNEISDVVVIRLRNFDLEGIRKLP